MNTRHRLRILVILIPIFAFLAVVSAARAGGEILISPKTQASALSREANDSASGSGVVLTDTQGSYPLGLYLWILEDPAGTLTIDDVSSQANAQKFTLSKVLVPNIGYTSDAVWVRFSLDNESSQTTEYLLEMGFSNTQYLDVYSPNPEGSGFVVRQSGALRPVSSRDVAYPNFIFNINLPLHSQHTYYLRIKSGASMTIPLTLWTKNAFIVESSRQLILHWLVFGGLFAILVYHLFLLIRLKELTYLYFVTMLACMVVFLLDYYGYLVVYFFPSLGSAKYYIIPLYVAGLYASIILFSDSFFELRTKYPRLHLVNIALLVAWGIFIILIPFFSYLNIARIGTPLQLVTIGATWVMGVYAWRKGAVSSQFFIFAWLGMAMSLFLLLLVRLGIIPSTSFDENVFQLGFIVMAVSWSLALADRIEVLSDQTESANRDLRESELKLSQILEGMPLGIVVYDKNQKPTFMNQRSVEILANPDKNIRPSVDAGRNLEQALDYFSFHRQDSQQKYPVEQLPVFKALEGQTAYIDDIVMDKGDNHFHLEIWANPIRDQEGNVKSAVAVFQDINQRKQAEAEVLQHRYHLQELVETRTTELDQANKMLSIRLEWLSAVIKNQQVIKGEANLPAIYEELASSVLGLLNASRVFILRWDYQKDLPEALYCLPHESDLPSMDVIREALQTDSSLGKYIEVGKIGTISIDQDDSLPGDIKTWLQARNIKFFIIVPMLIGQSFLGGLGIAGQDKLKDEFSQSKDLIERMGFDFASLTEDAILMDNTLALVASDERNRLARDLHDSVTQMLFTATLLTDVMPQIWRRDPDQGFQTLDKLRRLIRGSLAEMRTLLIELRPNAAQNIPLSELLSQLTEAITSRSGLPFQLFIEKIPLLPGDVQMAFYRVAQESLNNVVKHAQAIRVTVSLSGSRLEAEGTDSQQFLVRLLVQDDGVGFSTAVEKPGHLGLSIMRERAEAIQAGLTIESQPGHGTLVSLVWTGEILPDAGITG
jgi:signal transduction histidine kinase